MRSTRTATTLTAPRGWRRAFSRKPARFARDLHDRAKWAAAPVLKRLRVGQEANKEGWRRLRAARPSFNSHLVQPSDSSDTLEVRSRSPSGSPNHVDGAWIPPVAAFSSADPLTTDRVDKLGFPHTTIAVESQKGTTEIGYRHHNDQVVIQNTGLPGTDHNQIVYIIRCERCHNQYGSNGSDIHLRKCPNCQAACQALIIDARAVPQTACASPARPCDSGEQGQVIAPSTRCLPGPALGCAASAPSQ